MPVAHNKNPRQNGGDSVSVALGLVEAANEANKSSSTRKVGAKSEFDPTPFWLLIILLEQLLLFPSKKAEELKDLSLYSEICRRVRLLRSGKIRQLYQ